MRELVVLSGGMDSSTVLHFVVKKLGHQVVKTVTFNYGSKHNDQEYECAKKQASSLGIENVKISLMEVGQHLKSDLLKSGGEIPEGHYAEDNMKKTVVPFRNGIMLSIAAGMAESCNANSIVLGNHFGDHAIYKDCRAGFVVAMSTAITLGTDSEVSLLSPFVSMTKTDIAKIGNSIGVKWRDTYSCYKGGPIHCGLCGTCGERRIALHESGITDPTEYLDETPQDIFYEKFLAREKELKESGKI